MGKGLLYQELHSPAVNPQWSPSSGSLEQENSIAFNIKQLIMDTLSIQDYLHFKTYLHTLGSILFIVIITIKYL